MPELRHDPVREGWVIIATERARRPSDFKPPHNAKKGETYFYLRTKENFL